jgi:hypothetical protein
VNRYGGPVLRSPVIAALTAAVALGACSGGASHKAKATSTSGAPCPLFARLDDAVASVAQANVADPVAFNRTFDEAVQNYVATLQSLRPEVPAELRGDVDRLQAAVDQRNFQDAAGARISLDAYASSHCGRTLPPAPTTTVTTPTSTTTTTS